MLIFKKSIQKNYSLFSLLGVNSLTIDTLPVLVFTVAVLLTCKLTGFVLLIFKSSIIFSDLFCSSSVVGLEIALIDWVPCCEFVSNFVVFDLGVIFIVFVELEVVGLVIGVVGLTVLEIWTPGLVIGVVGLIVGEVWTPGLIVDVCDLFLPNNLWKNDVFSCGFGVELGVAGLTVLEVWTLGLVIGVELGVAGLVIGVELGVAGLTVLEVWTLDLVIGVALGVVGFTVL